MAIQKQAVWIPGCLCLAACKDPELREIVLNSVFNAGLIPLSVAADSAPGHWAACYSAAGPQVIFRISPDLEELITTKSLLAKSFFRFPGYIENRANNPILGA